MDRRRLFRALIGAIVVFGVQLLLVWIGATWVHAAARSASSGLAAGIAARRALGVAALFLAPWTPFATAALQSGLASGDGRRRPSEAILGTALGLVAAGGAVAALALLRARWGVDLEDPPSPSSALLFYGSLSLAASGLFLALRTVLGPESSFVVLAGALSLLTGSIFVADGFVEGADASARPGRIELVLATNPLTAAAGGVADIDLMRTERLYEASVIGPYYPYRYPDLFESLRRFLAGSGAGFAIALAGAFARRRLRAGIA